MKKTIITIILTTLLTLPAAAQTASADKVRERVNMFGAGLTNLLDSYLSPYNYHGQTINHLREYTKQSKLKNDRLTTQSLFTAQLGIAENGAHTGTEITSLFTLTRAWHFNYRPVDRLRLQLGPQIGGSTGFIYNVRNSNNPAEGILNLHIGLSAAALYDFHIHNIPLRARLQADIPLLGIMFSPHYGESYYEMFSLGEKSKGNFPLTHPLNSPSYRQLLTLDFPLMKYTIRAGWLCDIHQSKVHGLKRHIWSNSIMMGIVRKFQLL